MFSLAILGVLASVIAAGYYLRVVKIMYFDAAQGSPLDPVPEKTLRAVMAVASLSVLFFILIPAPLIESARKAAESLLFP